MDKLKALLQKLGIELTADQTKQIGEVIEKEFVPAAEVAANKGFKLENGEFVGGKEYLEGLKQSEPSVFAAEQKPGLFMGSTQSTESLDANNLETQVFSGFGLSSK